MKTRFRINPITESILDRSFQNMLVPFRCFQHMLFLSRFSIENNCIKPHCATYYIVSLVGTLGFVIFHIASILAQEFDEAINPFLVVLIKFNVILLVIPFISFYILNVIQRKDHVQIILKIQKAFTLIDYKNCKKAVLRNWFGIFRHFAFYIVSVSLVRSLNLAVYLFTLIYIDVNLTYGFTIIASIRDGMISWISEVEFYGKHCLELEDNRHYNDKSKKLFQAYINLMEAYDIFKKIFKFTVLFQASDTFFHSLLYFQTIIEIEKSPVKPNSEHILASFELVIILWVIKNVTFVSIFNTYCEFFYMTVSDAETACSRMLRSLQSTVGAKRLCKNVQRLNRAAFHKMTACRMFTVDGCLPEKFNSLMLEYTVVLLQFAMLKWLKEKI